MDRIEKHLARETDDLRDAIKQFDAGNTDKAYAMSGCVYKLVDDSGQNRSLATQCKIKGALKFVATPRKGWANIGFPTLQVSFNKGLVGGVFVTSIPMDLGGPELNFKKWWGQKLIGRETGKTMKRGDFVLVMRNQDGGAHVDEKIKNDIYNKLLENGMTGVRYYETEKGIFLEIDGIPEPKIYVQNEVRRKGDPLPQIKSGPFTLRHVVPVLMRQVAGELLTALERHNRM